MAGLQGVKNGNRDLAREYRRKFGMDYPTRALAKIMLHENPLQISNLEAARQAIMAIEGKHNGRLEKKVKDSEFYRPERRDENPYNLPESHAEVLPNFVLPKGCNKVLYLPDLHVPYHDIGAITVALNKGISRGANCIILPGDVVDMHQGSKYQSDPRKRSIKQEFEAAEQLLSMIREAFPSVPIYWLKGNHDLRWEDYLLRQAPIIFDDQYFHLEERLRLIDKNIQIFNDKTIINAGDLSITHGHLLFKGGFGAPVYPAKSVWDKTGIQYAIGHVHTVTTYKKVRKGAPNQMCYTMGCLSEKSPDYNPIVNRYEHGFGFQEIDSSGLFEFDNYRIENGKARI